MSVIYITFMLVVVARVSFSFLPKGGRGGGEGGGGHITLYGLLGGEHLCKTCGKLGGSWGMLLWEILILDLLLDAICWNLGLFSHKRNLPCIVSLKP